MGHLLAGVPDVRLAAQRDLHRLQPLSLPQAIQFPLAPQTSGDGAQQMLVGDDENGAPETIDAAGTRADATRCRIHRPQQSPGSFLEERVRSPARNAALHYELA